MASFLFEIGLEEVPARMIASAEAELRRRVMELLTRERLLAEDAKADSFSTPRRLAVRVNDVFARQDDVSEEMLGPAVKIAFPGGRDGHPGPAAVAFARKAGVDVDALKIVDTPKGAYIAATLRKPGRSAAEVLAEALPQELAGIYWAKSMYWRAGKPERFVRPVRWMVALLDQTVVRVQFAGTIAGRETYGHRVLFGAEPIALEAPIDYEIALRDAFVEPVVAARQHSIRKALDRVCRTIDGVRWREDHALVDKMTHLTEWPSVIRGSFEPAFLTLPEEVLVTVMRDHQNYFAVESKDGSLAPHFLAVLNTVTDAAGEATIRHGNERVLRARFNDARFFWEFDQRVPLVDRVALLEKVIFQKDLGSYAAKTERVLKLAGELAAVVQKRGASLDEGALHTAARLAKADLTTELVKEFTELQGVIGGLYARAQGYGLKVATAVADQYKPLSIDDDIAATIEGALLAVADKVDTLWSMFGLGLKPTGSKDPFALRRAANGVVKTLAEADLPLTLDDLLTATGEERETAAALREFFFERIAFYLHEVRGIRPDIAAAVMNNHLANPNIILGLEGYNAISDAVARAAAITRVQGSDNFLAVCAAYKRAKNLLDQVNKSSYKFYLVPSFATAEEQMLWAELGSAGTGYLGACQEGRYDDALLLLASLRPTIDQYFSTVMVLVEDEELRANRIGFVRYLVVTFAQIADFSEIMLSA
jgi:glycyl-tRNA synthetase beta chain